ncbi:MAG: response regulator [Alphaproteobacteria bacterium]|nr:response regulator [Alphaproteobacteria bacterium]
MHNARSASSEKGLSVLIVDDDVDMIRMIDTVLRDAGATHIQRARDGRQAINDLRKNLDVYDLIISDWEMPEVNGLELLQQVRIRRPELPFIMLTGRSKKEEILAAVQANVTAYISKPFAAHELKKKILAISNKPEPREYDVVEVC